MPSYTSNGAAYLGSEVVSSPLPVSLGSELRADFGIVVVGDVVNDECTLLTHRVDGQGAGCTRLGLRGEDISNVRRQ